MSDEFVNLPPQSINVDNEFINKGGKFETPPPTEPNPNQINTKPQNPFTKESNSQQVSNTEPQNPFKDEETPSNIETVYERNNANSAVQDIILPPKPRYHIINCYVLANYKLYNNIQLSESDPGVIVIGFNATFNNVRIAFHGLTNESFTNTSIILNNCPKLTSVNIFSETAENIAYNMKHIQYPNTISIVERLWQSQPNWTPNESHLELISPTELKLNTIDFSSNKYFNYIFKDWQFNAFINVMKMLINGNFWNLSMQSTFN